MADLSKMRDLCKVLGLNFLQRLQDEVDETVRDVDYWLTTDLTVETIHRLNNCVKGLCEMRLERFHEIKKKALAITQYCNALLVPVEKKQALLGLMCYMQADSAEEVTEANALSLEYVKKVEQEYHELRQQTNSMVLKKKSKLLQILKATHLTSRFIDKDIIDPLEAYLDMKKQCSELKVLACQRVETVTKMELIQYASEEVNWYRSSVKADADNERLMKAKILEKCLPRMLINLKAELSGMSEPFVYDEGDALTILKTIQAELTDATDKAKVKDMAATSVEKIAEDHAENEAGTSQVQTPTSWPSSTSVRAAAAVRTESSSHTSGPN